MTSFLRRNSILRTKKQLYINSVQVNGATTKVIKKWWPKLALLAIKAIKPDNCYNINKAKIIKGMGDNGLVVESIHKRFI